MLSSVSILSERVLYGEKSMEISMKVHRDGELIAMERHCRHTCVRLSRDPTPGWQSRNMSIVSSTGSLGMVEIA
jgi:hypothetical protein